MCTRPPPPLLCRASAGGDLSSDSGPYLSLRRLQLWLAEPLRRMRLLAALVDGCEGRVGGDLAGGVWSASKVGDPLASSYAARILHQVGSGTPKYFSCWTRTWAAGS